MIPLRIPIDPPKDSYGLPNGFLKDSNGSPKDFLRIP